MPRRRYLQTALPSDDGRAHHTEQVETDQDDPISYLDVLDRVHTRLQPRVYLEIGIRHGDAAAFALPGTRVIGVDPAPSLRRPLPKGIEIERRTSDDFFDSGRAAELLDEQKIDFAFIDGMHLFEFALRDLLNVEQFAAPGSLVMLHDCLPLSADAASREFKEGGWTGDVWKVLLYLRDHRPDLDICVFDAAPTGLAVVQGLNPSRPLLDISVDIDRYIDLDFSAYTDDLFPTLEVVRGDLPAMESRLSTAPWQDLPDVAKLTKARDRRRARRQASLRRLRRSLKGKLRRTRVGTFLARSRRRLRR